MITFIKFLVVVIIKVFLSFFFFSSSSDYYYKYYFVVNLLLLLLLLLLFPLLLLLLLSSLVVLPLLLASSYIAWSEVSQSGSLRRRHLSHAHTALSDTGLAFPSERIEFSADRTIRRYTFAVRNDWCTSTCSRSAPARTGW